MGLGDYLNVAGNVASLVSQPLGDTITAVGNVVNDGSASPGDYLRVAGDVASFVNPEIGVGLHVVGGLVDQISNYQNDEGDNQMAMNQGVPAYNPVQYSGTDQTGQMVGLNAYTQNQAQNQAGWQQGQQLQYNAALNNQAQLANQQFAQAANAAANANQQRQLVGAAASALNGIYANSMGQMNQAAQQTQQTLGGLAQSASGMFR
jgi:hypothetical protein